MSLVFVVVVVVVVVCENDCCLNMSSQLFLKELFIYLGVPGPAAAQDLQLHRADSELTHVGSSSLTRKLCDSLLGPRCYP